jgi:hypothetical protein
MMLPRHQNLGPPADGIGPDNYGPVILVACWLVEVLSSIIIGLRVYCKLKRSRALWYDDYILIAAWVGVSPSDLILMSIEDLTEPSFSKPPTSLLPPSMCR